MGQKARRAAYVNRRSARGWELFFQSSPDVTRHLSLALKILCSAGLLAYLLRSVDLADVIRHLVEGQHELFGAAVAIYFIVVLLSTMRWKVLLDPLGSRSTFVELTRSYLVSAFFANFLPSNIGGDAVRVREAAQAAGSHGASLTVTVVDRAMGFLALYVIAVPAYLLGGEIPRRLSGARIILSSLGLAFLLAGAIFLRPGLLERVTPGRHFRRLAGWVQSGLGSARQTIHAYRADKRALVRAFLLSLLLQFLGVLYFYAVARGLRISLNLGTALLMVPLCTLIQALPVSFNGWGLREGLYVFYFHQVGLSRESALAFSIVAATLVMLLSLSGLVVWLGRRTGPERPRVDV